MRIKNIVFLIMIFILSGCAYKGYSGEHLDLYTVAVNSVLWNNGYSYSADWECDPEIHIIETDNYGRKMFTDYERFYKGGEPSFSSLLIMQYSDDELVYYYDDVNFVVSENKNFPHSTISLFSEEQIRILKDDNGWNTLIEPEKCISKTISKNKEKLDENIEEYILDKTFEYFSLTEKRNDIFVDKLTNDDKGNLIVYGCVHDYDAPVREKCFIAYIKIIDDTLMISFLTPLNVYDYKAEYIEFKRGF